MTTREMMSTPCKPGYWFVNTSALGSAPDWVQQVAPVPENNKLFGYEKSEFLAKQYKVIK